MKTVNLLVVLSIVLLLGSKASAEDPKPIKIACLGDSITKGDGLKRENSYPNLLSKSLGKSYEVRNYGCSAATATGTGDRPYIDTKECKDALEFEPDVVVIMLGTNDSKPKEWAKPEKVEEGYKALIEKFSKLKSKPRIVLCTPPCALVDKWGIEEKVVAEGIRPLVQKIGKELKLPIVDVFKATDGKEDIHTDGIHLNADGTKLIAQAVSKELQKKK